MIDPGAWVKSGAYVYMVFIAILVLLIPIVLGLAAFSRRWTFEVFPTYWTLENFRLILLESPGLIKNSFLFSGIALVFGTWFVVVRLRGLRAPAAESSSKTTPAPDTRYASVIEKELKDLEEK